MRNKYKKIKLKNGKTIDEHRLIMQEHLGRELKRNEVVHHKNENPLDNRLSNLELMSLKEHTRMHAKNYIYPNGILTSNARLTEDDILGIRGRIEKKDTLASIAKDYSVGITTVHAIKSGRTWKHVK